MVSIVTLALAGAAAGVGYCYYRGACARAHKHEVKQELTRWEAEGGNVPEVDTPTPQAKPQSSYPPAAPAPDFRH
jgi:hypothetical protein